MKHLLLTLFLLVSSMSFAQQSGVISGRLVDAESNNEAMIFANVSIKGTGIQTATDAEGFFKFEDLKNGTYTLICSFAGYETKQLVATVYSGKVTEVTSSLSATTVSLDDLISLASAEDKRISANK